MFRPIPLSVVPSRHVLYMLCMAQCMRGALIRT
jgi:hypothetical protein